MQAGFKCTVTPAAVVEHSLVQHKLTQGLCWDRTWEGVTPAVYWVYVTVSDAVNAGHQAMQPLPSCAP